MSVYFYNLLKKGYAKSCLELKNDHGINVDGEYNLKISESLISVCFNDILRQIWTIMK